MSKVYLWDASERVAESRERERDFITDIVNADHLPPVGAILVGVTYVTNSELAVEALGAVKTSARVAQGRRRIRIEPLLLFDAAPVDDLLGELQAKVRARVERAGLPRELRPTRLPPTAAEAVLSLLRQDAAVQGWFASLEFSPPADSERLQEVQESRDAIGLAVEIADLPRVDQTVFSRPSRVANPEDVLASVLKNAHLADSEEDLIPEDLRRFEKNTKTQLVAGHVARFRGGDYELTVFNVNKKPFEVALGVDLIYWDTIRNIFTLVQYKRLDPDQPDAAVKNWVYKNEAEIRRQLGLMVTPTSVATTAADWRMTSPYWFKFVRRDAAQFQDGKLLKGMYVSADYLRLALDDGSLRTGPQGGFRVDYDNVKRLTRATFSELIRRGLIGTMSAQSTDLLSVILDLSSAGRSAIVAIKSRWEESKETVADLNSLLDGTTPTGNPSETTDLDELLADTED